jgi:hypothetical protein
MDGDKAKNSHRAVLLAVAAMIIVLLVGVTLAVSGAFTDKSTAKATEPDHPFLLTATAGSSLVHLTWAEPSSDGGSPITAYTVHYGPTQAMTSERIFSNTTLAADIDGVIPGTAYYFTVSANNSIGAGILSNRLSACPFTLPGAPTQALAVSGNGLVNLTWSAPTSDGSSPISSYRVYWGTDLESMTSSRDIVPALCTAQIGSLTPGSRYYFALAAVNSAGVGPRSVIVNATPFTIPGAPLQATVEASDGMITLTWAAPGSDGASAMTGYRIFWGIDEAMLATPLDVGPQCALAPDRVPDSGPALLLHRCRDERRRPRARLHQGGRNALFYPRSSHAGRHAWLCLGLSVLGRTRLHRGPPHHLLSVVLGDR